jgi:hypothetical protein
MPPSWRAIDIENQKSAVLGSWLPGISFMARAITGTIQAISQLIDSNSGIKVLASARCCDCYRASMDAAQNTKIGEGKTRSAARGADPRSTRLNGLSLTFALSVVGES